MDEPTIRLNKFLAERLGLSRREADIAIKKHLVLVNSKPAVIGQQVDKNDIICYNSKVVPFAKGFSYFIFHKPVGYVCSRKSQGETSTIYDLLPADMKSLKTVGRLDKDSSGLIILTDDGDFSFRMTHPKFVKTKVYEVTLDRDLEPLHQQMICDFGVKLNDGVSKLGLSRIDNASRKKFEVTMSEGRNRQIRRTFGALGYTVVELHRKQFGPYNLGDLKVGKYRKFDI